MNKRIKKFASQASKLMPLGSQILKRNDSCMVVSSLSIISGCDLVPLIQLAQKLHLRFYVSSLVIDGSPVCYFRVYVYKPL